MVSLPLGPKQPTHPIYPRPVPPLHYEPIQPRPEELLWEQDSTDDNDDEHGALRDAKRRRIEQLGEQYLKGQGLLIMSAAIRGPLGKDWKNPWMKSNRARRKQKRHRLATQKDKDTSNKAGAEMKEVPESVERGRMVGKEVNRPSREVQDVKNPVRGDGIEVDLQPFGHPEERLGYPKVVSAPGGLPAANNIKRTRQESEVRDRYSWLKTHELATPLDYDIYAGDVQDLHKSPSARIQRQSSATRTTPSTRAVEPLRPQPPQPDSFDGRAETIIKRLRRQRYPGPFPHDLQRRSPVEFAAEAKRGDATIQDVQAPLTTRALADGLGAPVDVQMGSSKETRSRQSDKASQRIPSPSANGSPDRHDLSEPRDERRIDPPTFERKKPQANSPESSVAMLASGSQKSSIDPLQHQGPPQTLPPATLSTTNTSATVVNVLPSAQVAPTAQVPWRNESVPSTGDKLPELQTDHVQNPGGSNSCRSPHASTTAANSQLPQGSTTTGAAVDHFHACSNKDAATAKSTMESRSGIIPFSAFNEYNKEPHHSAMSTDNIPNTEELLEAVPVFDLDTTVNKAALTVDQRSAPASPTSSAVAAAAAAAAAVSKCGKTAEHTIEQTTTLSRPPQHNSCTSRLAPSSGEGSGSSLSQGSIKASLKVSKKQQHHNTTTNRKSEPFKRVGFEDPDDGNTAESHFYSGKVEVGTESRLNHHQNNNGDDMNTDRGSSRDRDHHEKTSLPRSSSSTTCATWNQQDAQQDVDIISRTAMKKQKQKQKQKQSSPAGGGRRGRATSSDRQKRLQSRISASSKNPSKLGDTGGVAGVADDEDEDQNPFDLADAMDTVGSFLKSWDVSLES